MVAARACMGLRQPRDTGERDVGVGPVAPTAVAEGFLAASGTCACFTWHSCVHTKCIGNVLRAPARTGCEGVAGVARARFGAI